MADNFSLCLMGTMDRLWFHQIILFPEPFSLFLPKALKQVQQPTSDSVSTSTSPSSNSSLSLSSLAEENTAISHPLTPPDDSKNEKEEGEKERPTRVSLSSNRTRSHSSSPSDQKRQKHHRHSTSCSFGGKLQKSMSCRSLKDLELEEVKGFMDLGFVFKKEHLNKRIIRVVPGLLRLGFFKTQQLETDHPINLPADADDDDDDTDKDDDDDFEQEKRGVIRPYLSEAWLIRRPDSPLLNLRVPKFSAAADMKKHLKFWARTVASEIHQEC